MISHLVTIAGLLLPEGLSAEIVHFVLAALFAVLAFYLRRAVRLLQDQEHTRVKANLCFDDLTERKPAMQRVFEAMMGRS